MKVSEEDIFEADEKQLSITYDNSTLAENSGNIFSSFCNIPDSIIQNLQDFIAILQEDNKRLKNEIAALRNLLGENKT